VGPGDECLPERGRDHLASHGRHHVPGLPDREAPPIEKLQATDWGSPDRQNECRKASFALYPRLRALVINQAFDQESEDALVTFKAYVTYCEWPKDLEVLSPDSPMIHQVKLP
jgi:hypothetical protein